MIREITSSTNPLVKELRALASSKKARQESGTFIIEGWRGIKTLLEHESRGYTLEQLVVSSGWDSTAQLPEAIETIQLPEHLFEKVSDVRNAQGILGVVRHTPYPFEFFPDTGNYLLLDNLRDPGNLGTLIRSAVGAGFDGILLYGDCVEPFNPKVIRSTMGTFAFSNLWHIGDKEVSELLEHGYDLCVTTGLGGNSLYETAFGRKNVLVIGSEAHGVSGNLMQRATRKITIPLAKECESLNAAIAGSVCMFHLRNA
ncbi:23S rRNA (uridine(2479)-2'-O)-methyltransferase [Pontiella desulfatans]|uniref:23S rRNA (Uridine(2479)-2'-O)-methyltransferase n=1 Tax=Pontiella desulfatans TaxID=2750659 RepID=A0A6C2TYR1_PONDE|nr:RNA methyltransferase [Pontiella desulfatans]VGO12868.1 23S rRNA (uridine(2479)-2'-O)-methyltransferase [Pontiella desulfatans]